MIAQTIVLEITRITIVHIILNFWACSKNQCTLENDQENKEFDKAALTRAVARIAVEHVLKPRPRVYRARVRMLFYTQSSLVTLLEGQI